MTHAGFNNPERGAPSYDHADESLSIHPRWPGRTGGRRTDAVYGRATVRRPARFAAGRGPARFRLATQPETADRRAEHDARSGRRPPQPRARSAAGPAAAGAVAARLT